MYRDTGGSTFITHIFSPVGYTECMLTKDQQYYQVLPTFGTTKPITYTILATFVGIQDEDGTVMFSNYDNSNGNKWPVAFVPRTGYAWIRYAGVGDANEKSEGDRLSAMTYIDGDVTFPP